MTELAVFESNLPALPARVGVPGTQEFDSWVQVADKVIKLASHICDTPFVPDGMRGSAPAVAAAILAGREMGLGPMTSLANLDVIKGKPSMKPVLMRALVQSRGHKWVDVEVSDVRVIIKGCRKGESEWTEVTFTQAHAKIAGISLGGYPADKLYARASSRLARRKFADAIMGMPYSDDEIEDGITDAGEVIEGAAPAAIEAPKPRTAQRRTRQAAEPADRPSGAPSAAGSAGATQDRQRPAPATTAPGAQPSLQPTEMIPVGTEHAGLPPLPGEDPVTEESDIDKDAPGSVLDSDGMVGKIQTIYSSQMDFKRTERDQIIAATEQIIGRELTGPVEGKTHNNLSWNEARVLIDTLERCGTREHLVALLAESRGPDPDGDAAAERAFKAGDTDG
jgi:hypothetical protein